MVGARKSAGAGPRAAGSSPRPQDKLPYVIELWYAERSAAVERVLARAQSARLAREIFKAASSEYPERRVTLQKAGRVVADTKENGTLVRR